MRMMRMTVLLALLGAATGCMPAMLFQDAQPVGAGKTMVGAATSGSFSHGEGIDKKRGAATFGDTTAFVRHGFSDAVDAGVEVAPGVARADVKVSLPAGTGFRIAIDPGIEGGYAYDKEDQGGGAYSTTALSITGADATLIVGHAIGGGGEAYIAPRFLYESEVQKDKTIDPVNGNSTDKFSTWMRGWGAAVGATLPMGKLELVPEIGIYATESHSQGDVSRSWAALPGIAFRTRF